MGFFDNERYLISALVQSLAATIALVITLSLVAVQLAAQSYSARVIDVYKNNPDMWILLSIYIVVIFYGLGLLKVIDIGVAGINMEFAIFAAYFLGFFAFVCLVPYMLKTLDLLKPSTVIKLLAADITKERILESLEKDGEIADKDPVQPIIDMINAALERNDYETVRNGLIAIKNSTILTFKAGLFEEKQDQKIAGNILQHISKLGIQAANRGNSDSTLFIIKCVYQIWKNADEQELEGAIWESAIALEEIGIKATKKDFKWASLVAAEALGKVGIRETENRNLLYVLRVSKALEKMGEIAFENKLEATIMEILKALIKMNIIAIATDFKSATNIYETSLMKLREIAIEKESSIIELIENGLNLIENAKNNPSAT